MRGLTPSPTPAWQWQLAQCYGILGVFLQSWWPITCDKHITRIGTPFSCTRSVLQSGSTPLHYAASLGLTDVVHMLVTAGCDVARRDREGVTAVDLATALVSGTAVDLATASE